MTANLDKNILINSSLWIATLLATIFISPIFLVTPIVFHVLNDFLYWKFQINAFSSSLIVKRSYQAVHFFLDNQSNEGIDLGFNFYEGDLTKSRVQAQQDKWVFMWDSLGLKAGDRLIDVGCGYGDWLKYARGRGAQVVGINITKEQAIYAQEKSQLDVINIDWRKIADNPQLRQRLYGQFDAVTFMDTIEHYVPPAGRYQKEIPAKTYKAMFDFAYQLLDDNSSVARVFLSCLHQVEKKLDFKRKVCLYLLNRTMNGYYPIGDDGLSKYSQGCFKELMRVDKTEDYRITGVLEKDHFQSPKVKVNLKRLFYGLQWIFIDPYFFHRLFGAYILENWMPFFGEDAFSTEFNSKKRRAVSYVKLWMILFEKASNKNSDM